MMRITIACGIVIAAAGTAAAAQPKAVSCGGFAMLGAAQLQCSHVNPRAPAQLCTYSWSLHTTTGEPKVVEGSFLVVPGAVNVMVYQGSGFDSALSNPIVMCRGRKGK